MNALPPSDHPETADLSHTSARAHPLHIAWRGKWFVLLGLFVGLAGGVLFQAQRAPVYQTAAQVLVVKKRPDVLPIPGSDSQSSLYDDYLTTHLVLIRSPLIVERAVKNHNLASLPSFAGHSDTVPSIIGSMTATRDSKEWSTANIVNLTYRGAEAEDCPVVLAAVIDSYKEFLDETYRNVSDNTLELITKARDLLDKDLKEKRKKYRRFREEGPLVLEVAPKDGVTPSQARLGELGNKRLALRVRAAEIEERLRAVENARKQGTAREVVQALSVSALDKATPGTAAAGLGLQAQLLPLLLQEQALLEDYGEDHPQVKAVRRKIELARELHESDSPERKGLSKGDSVEAYVKALQQELANLEVGQQSLARLVVEEHDKSKEMRRFEDEDEEYRTDIAQTHALWDQTIKRLQEINVVRDFGGYSVQTISSPATGGKVGAAGIQTVLAGAIIGLLLGFGVAYVADGADKSFRTPEEIRRRLQLHVFAHVPLLEDEGMPSSPDAPQLERSLASYHRPTSPEAEAYRSARTAVFFSTRDEVHKVIQVTSPKMGDGKSTIAANLAIAIAQSGKSVVLVDGDLRRPRVHHLFGVPSGNAGLTSVIAGTTELKASLEPSGVDNLTLLVSGPLMANPAELLTLPRFEQVLRELRDLFDFVVIDTPPLLAVTDPCIVAPRADGVILVVRLGNKDRPAAERARETLGSLGANILGVVVNGVGRDAAGYGYYQPGYGYGYGNGYSKESNGASTHQPTNGASGTRRKKRKSTGWFARLWP